MSAIPSSSLPGHSRLHSRVVGALEVCQESQDVEFKAAAVYDELKHHIIRTSLAMTNLRDGGVIVIGLSEHDSTWAVEGIDEATLASYDEDQLNDTLGNFASPAIRVELVAVDHEGKQFLAINVREFVDSPCVCKKNGPDGSKLEKGALYVRPPGKPQTTRIRDAEDMRELLELAAEKRARRILQTARAIGLSSKAAEDAFDAELGDL